jgi:hypothetical protein
MFLNKIIKQLKQRTLLKGILNISVRKTDKLILANNLSFKKYYKVQKILGFPVQKIMFWYTNGYFPDLKNPKSFSEKCTYLKLYSRNPLLELISDKFKVRDYISEKIGKDKLISIIQVVDDPNKINFDKLPDEFVIKTNFASGQNIIIENKDNCDNQIILKKLERWMRMKYRIQELIWFPQKIERKIIVEELLKTEKGMLPNDYKFYVFNSEVKVILVVSDRLNDMKRSYFDINWRPLEFKASKMKINRNLSKPKRLPEMVKIAELLGKDFDFMRVDLYEVDDKIYFGELTAYPGDGRLNIEPISWDYKLGNYWKMNLSYINQSTIISKFD